MNWKLILTLFFGFIRWCGAAVLAMIAYASVSSWAGMETNQSNKTAIREKQLQTQLADFQSKFKKCTNQAEQADSLARQSFILRQLNRFDEAETALSSSLALTKDPSRADLLKANLAEIQRDNQEFDAAIGTLSELITRDKELKRHDLLKRDEEHLAVIQELKRYSLR